MHLFSLQFTACYCCFLTGLLFVVCCLLQMKHSFPSFSRGKRRRLSIPELRRRKPRTATTTTEDSTAADVEVTIPVGVTVAEGMNDGCNPNSCEDSIRPVTLIGKESVVWVEDDDIEEEGDMSWPLPLELDLEDFPPHAPFLLPQTLAAHDSFVGLAAVPAEMDDIALHSSSPSSSPSSAASSTRSPPPLTRDNPTSVEIADHLEQWGLFDHLLFAIQRQEPHLRTVLNRFAALMEWLIDTQPRFKACTLHDLQLHIKLFIAEDYDLMSSYVQYLAEHKHYQPATVVGHIDDIRICCTWFVLFRARSELVQDNSRMKQHEMLGFLTSVKLLRKILNKKVRFIKTSPCLHYNKQTHTLPHRKRNDAVTRPCPLWLRIDCSQKAILEHNCKLCKEKSSISSRGYASTTPRSFQLTRKHTRDFWASSLPRFMFSLRKVDAKA